jgi:photosystem II stability/assembly factor-like uncharacterized protein
MMPRSLISATVISGILLLAAVAPVTAQGFNAIATQDGFDIWAVGDGGSVYRSLDGGSIWGSYPLGLADHNAVAARGSRVWIASAGGVLWTSTNSGASFAPQTLAGGVDLRGLAFADDQSGWVAGSGGTILHTTDAGATWSPQTSGTSATLNALRFANALEGWACGNGGTIVHTTDGGATWTASTPFTPARDLYDIDFDDTQIIACGSYAFFARSTNGGTSWSPVDLLIESKSDVNGVEILAGGTSWLCGGGGFLRKSTDGGATSTYPIHPVVSGLTDIVFFDSNRGWACAAKSLLVARTTDGGASWSVPGGGAFTYTWSQKVGAGATSIRGNTFCIDGVNRNKIYAVQGKTVYASWNRGDTWTAIATISGTGIETNSFYASVTDTNTWVAAVQAGDRITRTTDGGVSWTTTLAIPFSEYGMPLERDLSAPNTLYFAPEDGQFWKSTNFGATWTSISNPGFDSPCDVVAVPDTSGILYVGDTGGEISRSTNGGVTWVLERNVGSSEIPSISASALDNRIAYATAWGSGGVQKTTNTGDTWPNITPTGSAWGSDVAKDDPYVAMYSVYSGSTSYVSTNNGASFQTSGVSGSNYGVLLYDRGTWLLHQSGGIWKANITQPGMPVNNAQLLTLTAPNGGEVWQYNETKNVSWSSQNIVNVKLEYRNSPESPWQLITASTSAPAGIYPWVVPNDPTDEAQIRVSNAADSLPRDRSDGTFAIIVPAIAATPVALDFGDVPVGSSAMDTLRIFNTGSATLVISSVTAAGGEGSPFEPSRASFSIPVGASDTIAVAFSPKAALAYLDTLVIATNAPATPTLVPLAGAGASPVDVAAPSSTAPTRFELRGNSPNPFGYAGTDISYAIPRECPVKLTVYNASGQVVATLVNDRQPAGNYAVRFPSAAAGSSAHASLGSGVYFYRLDAGGFVETKQMILVR